MNTEIEKNKYGYFIEIKNDYSNLFTDYQLAKLLGIPRQHYQDYLIENYNAFVINDEAYFESKEHAQNAIEWIISSCIINKLIGD